MTVTVIFYSFKFYSKNYWPLPTCLGGSSRGRVVIRVLDSRLFESWVRSPRWAWFAVEVYRQFHTSICLGILSCK